VVVIDKEPEDEKVHEAVTFEEELSFELEVRFE
jgi:hypothetical protein